MLKIFDSFSAEFLLRADVEEKSNMGWNGKRDGEAERMRVKAAGNEKWMF